MKRSLLLMAALLIVSAGTASAARTSISDIWKDKEYQGPATKIAVFCIMHDTVNRILYEDEFVRQFKARGVNAMPGYVVIPPDKFVEKDAAIEKMKALGVDAVLSTRLIDKIATETPVSKEATSGSPNRPGFYEQVYDPKIREDNEPAYLETNLLDLKRQQRVWTVRSKTRLDRVNKDIFVGYIELILDKLASDKMIK